MKTTTDTANTIKDILCRLEKSKFKKLPESLQRRKSKTKIGRNNGSMFVRFICRH
jgi:hypothetical protein